MTPNQQSDHIDQILTALAHAAPPTGMEQRILQALEAQTLEPLPSRPVGRSWNVLESLWSLLNRSKWHGVGLKARSIPAQGKALGEALGDRPTKNLSAEGATYRNNHRILGMALLSAAAGVVFIVATLHHTHRPEPAIGPVANYLPAAHSPLQMKAEDARKQHPMPLLNPPTTAHRVGKAPGPPPPFRWASTTPPHPASKILSSFAEGGGPASTASLPSYPAPPMPLTPQEKILLRIAHHDDPQSLTPLTPAGRAAEQAQDNAAFQDFFPPPVPAEYPTLISQFTPPVPVPTSKHGAAK